jgi:hypothetical protein
MSRPLAFAAAFLALSTVGCAQSATPRSTSAISFEIGADPSKHVARLTCKKA